MLRVLVAIILLAGCSRQPEPGKTATSAPKPPEQQATPYGPEFSQQWNDGQAEVAVYNLATPVDGEIRKGTAIAVTSTESFSNSARARANPALQSGSDVIPAMRFNLMRRYRTGVEDHSDMLSAVIALAEASGLPPGAVTRLSSSHQGWSGHTWSQLLFNKNGAIGVRHSDAQGDVNQSGPLRGPVLAEDALPLVARRIAWPQLRLGHYLNIDLLGSADLEVTRIRLNLPNARETVETPAGSFRCHRFTAHWSDGRTKTWFVQGDAPYRIVRWTFSDGEHAELLGAERMKYQELSKGDQAAALRRLGLP